MTLKMTLRELVKAALDRDMPIETPVTGVAQDNRKVEPGFVFVARAGGATDGHAYAADAAARGAVAIVGERSTDTLAGLPYVQVADAKDEIRGGSLNEDLLHYRLPPGEGDFTLKPTLKILNEIGGFSYVGIELFSDDFDAMNAEEAGEAAGRSLRNVLADSP